MSEISSGFFFDFHEHFDNQKLMKIVTQKIFGHT